MVDLLPLLFNEFKHKYYAQDENTEAKDILYKQYKTKLDESVYYFCYLPRNNLTQLKDIKIYGFWPSSLNEYTCPADYSIIDLNVKFQCSGCPIEIRKIYAGNIKRLGKGSAGIKFIEELVIPEINKILFNNGFKDQITYIYGISADLSPDTDLISRARFYAKNGFTMRYSHFYKYLK